MGRSRRGAAPARRPAAPPARRPAAAPVRTAAKPAAPTPAPTPPAPAPAAAPPAPMQASSGGGGMLSGIGSTIAQGFAFGAGSAVAHRAVGAVADSFSGGGGSEAPAAAEVAAPVAQSYAAPSDACTFDRTNFNDCLKQNVNNESSCNFLYEQLKSCQQNQAQFQ